VVDLAGCTVPNHVVQATAGSNGMVQISAAARKFVAVYPLYCFLNEQQTKQCVACQNSQRTIYGDFVIPFLQIQTVR
jgi:hypothetical protein